VPYRTNDFCVCLKMNTVVRNPSGQPKAVAISEERAKIIKRGNEYERSGTARSATPRGRVPPCSPSDTEFGKLSISEQVILNYGQSELSPIERFRSVLRRMAP